MRGLVVGAEEGSQVRDRAAEGALARLVRAVAHLSFPTAATDASYRKVAIQLRVNLYTLYRILLPAHSHWARISLPRRVTTKQGTARSDQAQPLRAR